MPLQTNGLGSLLLAWRYASIAAVRSGTDLKTPRRMAFSASSRNQRSTEDLPLSIRHDQSGARSAHEHALLRIPTYLRDTILGPVSQGSFDTLSESSLAAVETLRIDAMQDFDGVAGPLGDVESRVLPHSAMC